MTRLNEPPQRPTEPDRRHPQKGNGPEVGRTPPAGRERVRIRLLEDGVVLPQLVDVWLASWELEAESRRLDSSTPDYWEAGAGWIRAKSVRPD
jgi:hypothetical protein